ncbi:MAG: protease inhibitor I9 family protein, partial [Wenzhouxiangellaceae bacterium]|nr:protease inhibitor I9 family protein [Wenzhouxiangellaceae bacterium]
MKTRTIVSAIALAAAGLAASVAVAQPPEGRFLDVIVSLDADTGSQRGNRDFAATVAGQHAINARHTYGTVFTGFAARIPEAAYARLQNDPLVQSISFDGTVHASMG